MWRKCWKLHDSLAGEFRRVGYACVDTFAGKGRITAYDLLRLHMRSKIVEYHRYGNSSPD